MSRSASNRTASAAPSPSTGRKFRVASPIERVDGEGRPTNDPPFWQGVGRAFENQGRDGKRSTITVLLNALPVNGRIVLFEDDGRPKGQDDAAAGDASEPF